MGCAVAGVIAAGTAHPTGAHGGFRWTSWGKGTAGEYGRWLEGRWSPVGEVAAGQAARGEDGRRGLMRRRSNLAGVGDTP